MVEEWFSGSGSGSDPGSGSGQVLTSGPVRLKGPKRQNFPNDIFSKPCSFNNLFSASYGTCKHPDMRDLFNPLKHLAHVRSRTWSEPQSVGVNVSFLVKYYAFTNCAGDIFTSLLHKL